ncbi:hypothetical protein L484_021416 [Morus notabilis]|uniref:Uncharacterized protein n=1 Tax=Morus notabilis TaxID=981085 RepID=W9RPC0_9ROSA|nr:hypothetical protein L484_021416 [Morus notabilis]
MRSINIFVEVISDENGLNLEFPSDIIRGGQFDNGLMGDVFELKVLGWISWVGDGNNLRISSHGDVGGYGLRKRGGRRFRTDALIPY